MTSSLFNAFAPWLLPVGLLAGGALLLFVERGRFLRRLSGFAVLGVAVVAAFCANKSISASGTEKAVFAARNASTVSEAMPADYASLLVCVHRLESANRTMLPIDEPMRNSLALSSGDAHRVVRTDVAALAGLLVATDSH